MKILLYLLLVAMHQFGLAVGDDTSERNTTTYTNKDISTRIFGGLTAMRGQYNYVARLQIKFSGITGTTICSGVVLTRNIILTVAQCLRQPGGKTAMYVRATLPWNFGSFLFAQNEIIVHPDYNELYGANVAILRKNSQGQFMPVLVAPTLPPQRDENAPWPDITNPVVVGWGWTSDKKNYPRQLQFARVTAMDPNSQDCSNAYPELAFAMYDNEEPICTLRNVAGICEGDWGGPLLDEAAGSATLVALSMFRQSVGCNNVQDTPSAYYPVSYVTNWIQLFTTPSG